MRQSLAALGSIVFAAGCSLIYNPSNIGTGSSSGDDARIGSERQPDADVIVDADRAALTLTGVFPTKINEGQGDGSSRETLLVISGSDIGSDAQVTITVGSGAGSGSAHFTVDTANLALSADHHLIAVPIAAPVDIALGAGSSVPLTITVMQSVPGGTPPTVTQTIEGSLVLVGLDELTSQTAVIAPLYSRIELGSATPWTGTPDQPVVLTATSTITVANMTAIGGAASGATPGGGGPGGCAGGAPEGDGGCTGFAGFGARASAAGGGGGGGFGSAGMTGAGTGGGQGGPASGSPQVPLFSDGINVANRASGGGGGGGTAGTVGAGTGGAGGGGGGAIELSAGGSVTVASINVIGGKGGNGSTGTVGGSGGGGGGGAGGLVVLRSASSGISIGGAVVIDGGGGGAGAGTGAGTGGIGATGRFRWDAPAGTPPQAAHRGLSIDPLTTYVFTDTASPGIVVFGSDGDNFDVYITDDTGNFVTDPAQPTGLTISGTSLTVHPNLVHGFNHVCMSIQGGKRKTALSDTCIDVAYLP